METRICDIILQQLGGKRFILMTGCKNFINIEDGLRFSVSRNKTSINRCDIKYNRGTDTYNVRFYRHRVNKFYQVIDTTVKEFNDVYADMLENIYTSVTGQYTRL